MFEQVNETVRFVKAATSIGVVTRGNKAFLIDSGLYENLVRKIINSLEREGVTVAAIENTHSHADHCGARRACGRIRALWSANPRWCSPV